MSSLREQVAEAIKEHDPYKVLSSFDHHDYTQVTVRELKDRQADAAIAAVLEYLIVEAEDGPTETNWDCHGCDINADIVRWLSGHKENPQ